MLSYFPLILVVLRTHTVAWQMIGHNNIKQLPVASASHHFRVRKWSVAALSQSGSSYSEDNESSSEGDKLSPKNDIERQRQHAMQILGQIQALKSAILGTPEASWDDFQKQIDTLEKDVIKLESELVPPRGLTLEEYKACIIVFLKLPFSVRWALCQALELPESQNAASDIRRVPEIVTQLFQQRYQLTPQRVQDAVRDVQKRIELQAAATPISTKMERTSSYSKDETGREDKETNVEGIRDLFLDGKSEGEMRVENNVNNLLARVTRKEGMEATKQDLDILLRVLNKDIFAVSGTEKIPGGYIVRGSNKMKTGTELIQAIDSNLPANYPCQASFMYDISSSENAGLLGADPVLVLLNKDMTPRVGGFLTTLCSTAAIISTFLFCVGTFGANDLVTARLSESQAVSDADGVSWFTSKVFDVLLPLFSIQAIHELGHAAVAKSKNIETTLPTLLPFWSLPFMGAKTQLLTSPANRTALFDFALMGPLLGFIASIGCLAIGLGQTVMADSATLQYFPALPVGLLKISALGATLVDFFLGGGLDGSFSRFITLQDPATPIALHPFAIAGFVSLLVNALAMLPLGSTDGGRISLSIFGRYGHTFIGAAVWFAILFASFLLQRVDVLIGAWLVNNIVQNDMEIPCRDETEDVSIPRIMVAFSLWFITILAIVPLS